MEIIEQPWEKINLGVNSAEFRFDGKEDIKDIKEDILDNNIYNYQVSRVPVGRMDIVYLLQQNGFLFSETSIELSADLKKLELPRVYSRYIELMDYHLASDSELQFIEEAILSGIFDTDKISLDPYFGKKQAGVRFANWNRQEIVAGKARAYVVTLNDDAIGFFVVKMISDKVDYSLLAALYDKEKNSGIGFSVLYFPMLQSKRARKRRITTGVSSNNPDSVRMHLELGYKIKEMNYVLIKHMC